MSTTSRSLIGTGVFAVVIGLIAVIWPGLTIGAFVGIFALYATVTAVAEAATAFSRRRFGPVAGHLLLAVIDVAAAVLALAWPGLTAQFLVYLVAAWAVVRGVTGTGFAFAMRGAPAGARTWVGLGGVIDVVLGLTLFAQPLAGAFALTWVFGMFALIAGAMAIAYGYQMRRAEQVPAAETEHRVVEQV